MDGPLILLGEPGSGKSTLLREFKERTNSICYDAVSIMLSPAIEAVSKPSKIIIDGIDEVTVYKKSLYPIIFYQKSRIIIAQTLYWHVALLTGRMR